MIGREAFLGTIEGSCLFCRLVRRLPYKRPTAFQGEFAPQPPPQGHNPSTSSSEAPDSQYFYSLNKRITHLVRSKLIVEARSVFDNACLRNTITWNSMITGYVKKGEVVDARKLFDEMPQRDVTSWNVMMSGYVACREEGYLREAKRLFDRMPERDCVSWNTMINGFLKMGKVAEASELFKRMPERNVVSWNMMVSGFLLNGHVEAAIGLFRRMPARDSASISSLVLGLVRNGELDEAARILAECGSSCRTDDMIYAYNTLIAGYGERGQVEEARQLFNRIPLAPIAEQKQNNSTISRNLVTWNTMIACHVKARDVKSARALFDEMKERDSFSWNTMISGYVQVCDIGEALRLFKQMPNPDTLTWNTMISGYAELGMLDLALEYFERMPCRNIVSWNSIIAGYEKNEDYEGAIGLFIRMLNDGLKPDRHTLSSTMAVCRGLTDLHLGMQIHQLVIKTVDPDLPIKNSLVTMYSSCGAISEARPIFNEIKSHKNVISWNAMIGGCASHGYASEALEIFDSMKKLGVGPTHITFISVLSACAHVGLVEEGKRYFKSMIEEFGIEPREEHFSALVDLVARYGQLDEAMSIIAEMPLQPNAAVWGALLSACRVHNNVELARVAADALMKLQPESSSPYVLLYNMHANAGQWDEATEVRMVMEKDKIKKQRGYSRMHSTSKRVSEA
ncbi:hypothetical protein MLD38_013511 [Melastoma candidum]|uniref:Uncharacterized protein n=1 Tax=Melastoma candidum TaxID=119954 RepID=A0ACB9RDG4_9MYRT|nr:hypothetical protein MLD38_013511 [Melastoma candidum]